MTTHLKPENNFLQCHMKAMSESIAQCAPTTVAKINRIFGALLYHDYDSS